MDILNIVTYLLAPDKVFHLIVVFYKYGAKLNKVQVEILGLSSSPSTGGAYALLLKETYGVRRLPIIIGAFEAQAIALELEGITPPRPLTHDLIKSIIENSGATVTEVVITELKDNTFFAAIHFEMSSIINNVDSRPSDAIALAVRTGSPIYVAEEVMAKASFIPSSQEKIEDEIEFDDEEEIIESPANDFGKETDLAALQDKLRQALEQEDYEYAARLRDEINDIKKSKN